MATDGHGALQPSRSPNTKEHPLLPANTHFPQGIGAAFYDLDGTILDLTRVSERTVAALDAVHAAGCANVISTGRNLPIVPDAIRLPCIDYYITVNGGQILDGDGRHLTGKAIPRDTALDMARWLHSRGAGLNVLTSRGAYFERRLVSYMTQAVHRLDDSSTLSDEDLDEEISSIPNRFTVDDVEPEILAVDEVTSFVEKMGACFDTADDLARDAAELEGRGDLQIAVVTPTEIEITLKGVEKGSGIEWVRERLGLDREQLVAFGDSGNDLPMVPHVGAFVAVGNASEAVMSQATCVVDTMWEDGVARWLEHALEGEWYEA